MRQGHVGRMHIVVIGGTGNIGSALVRRLDGNHELHVVARRRPTTRDGLGAAVTVHAVDVSRDELRPVLAEADAVIHLGWLFQPTHRPEVTWHNNVGGTARVLQSLRPGRASVLIVASSIAAYSPVDHRRPVDETAPTHGASAAAYSREKAYVERMLDAFEMANRDLRVVRLRPAFVFQRWSASQQRRLFAGPLVPGSLVRPGLVPLLPVPRGLTMQAVHADDVAAAIEATLTGQASGAFNLAADESLDGDDLAGIFEAHHLSIPPGMARTMMSAGWRARLSPAPPQLFDALMRLPVLDTSRARTQLGWSPTVGAAAAVGEMLQGLREGAGWPTPPLDPRAGGRGRWREFVTGIGQRLDTP
jgi:UDP-glucose 4-epimerase